MQYQFKAEVKQVLDIVINSLYTDKEIFVRELVSNASDASEKLRYAKLSQDKTPAEDELKIKISLDDKAQTFTIEDCDELEKVNYLMARKFDEDFDDKIINKLYDEL